MVLRSNTLTLTETRGGQQFRLGKARRSDGSHRHREGRPRKTRMESRSVRSDHAPLREYVLSELFELSVASPRSAKIHDVALERFQCLGEHQAMQSDVVRVKAFTESLSAGVVTGRIVMDLGCGPDALLAIAAAQAGARKVYAVEGDPTSAEAAAATVSRQERAGLIPSCVVDVIAEPSSVVPSSGAVRLQSVEVLVHELLGFIASSEGVCSAVSDILPCLSTACVSIPQRAQTLIAPGKAPPLELFQQPEAIRWRQRIGPQQKYLLFALGRALPRELLLANPLPWEDLVFNLARWKEVSDVGSTPRIWAGDFVVDSSSEVEGFYVWLRFNIAVSREGHRLEHRKFDGETCDWVDCASTGTSWPVMFLPLACRTMEPRSLGSPSSIRVVCETTGLRSASPQYRFICQELRFDTNLKVSELYPLIGGDYCHVCFGSPASAAEACSRRRWLQCGGCARSFHRWCLSTKRHTAKASNVASSSITRKCRRRNRQSFCTSMSFCPCCCRSNGSGAEAMTSLGFVPTVSLAYNCGGIAAVGRYANAFGPSAVFAAAPISEGSLVDAGPALRFPSHLVPMVLREHVFRCDEKDEASQEEHLADTCYVPLNWGLLFRDISEQRPVANVAWGITLGPGNVHWLRIWARRPVAVWDELVLARSEPDDDMPGPNALSSFPRGELIPSVVTSLGLASSQLTDDTDDDSCAQAVSLVPRVAGRLRVAPSSSETRRLAVFALVDFTKGDMLDSSPLVPIRSEDVQSTMLEDYTFCLASYSLVSYLPLGFIGICKTSSEPNGLVEWLPLASTGKCGHSLGHFRVNLYAAVAIAAGEEICISYSTEYWWRCGIHKPVCGGCNKAW